MLVAKGVGSKAGFSQEMKNVDGDPERKIESGDRALGMDRGASRGGTF
jgi:hypothetical protein